MFVLQLSCLDYDTLLKHKMMENNIEATGKKRNYQLTFARKRFLRKELINKLTIFHIIKKLCIK